MKINILNNKNIPDFDVVIEKLEHCQYFNDYDYADTYIICSKLTLEYFKDPHLKMEKSDNYKPLVSRWNGYKVLIDNELPEGIVDIR